MQILKTFCLNTALIQSFSLKQRANKVIYLHNKIYKIFNMILIFIFSRTYSLLSLSIKYSLNSFIIESVNLICFPSDINYRKKEINYNFPPPLTLIKRRLSHIYLHNSRRFKLISKQNLIICLSFSTYSPRQSPRSIRNKEAR